MLQSLEPESGLRELRGERGLSLEAVSVLTGLDIATISRIERGLQSARPDTVVRLARGLGIAARRMQAILDQPAEGVS
jgi:transcriptional regulator with XRE-family HTH domain